MMFGLSPPHVFEVLDFSICGVSSRLHAWAVGVRNFGFSRVPAKSLELPAPMVNV